MNVLKTGVINVLAMLLITPWAAEPTPTVSPVWRLLPQIDSQAEGRALHTRRAGP